MRVAIHVGTILNAFISSLWLPPYIKYVCAVSGSSMTPRYRYYRSQRRPHPWPFSALLTVPPARPDSPCHHSQPHLMPFGHRQILLLSAANEQKAY